MKKYPASAVVPSEQAGHSKELQFIPERGLVAPQEAAAKKWGRIAASKKAWREVVAAAPGAVAQGMLAEIPVHTAARGPPRVPLTSSTS